MGFPWIIVRLDGHQRSASVCKYQSEDHARGFTLTSGTHSHDGDFVGREERVPSRRQANGIKRVIPSTVSDRFGTEQRALDVS